MARTTRPLTNTEVQQAKPKNKEYNLADGQGLLLRVKPNGSKIWIFNYSRPYTKQRANISLGTFPDLSLARARERRQEFRELLAQDIDPKNHRDDQRRQAKDAHGNTFERVFEKWLARKKSQVSAGYARDVENAVRRHVLPRLGRVPVHKITAKGAIEVLEPLAARGALETVRRLCQRLNEIMVFAANTGIVEFNQLSGIQKAFDMPRRVNMPTLEPSQLPELMATLNSASIKRTTRCLIEWQLHTMVRPKEAAGARWDEIDFRNEIWKIPADRMKKKRPHVVPLTPQALALLEVMKPISAHREFIFPSDRDPRDHINVQTANMALKRMGYGKKLVAHGLRALASTTLNEQGFDPDVIESALAHTDKNEVRAAYNRAEYLDRRRAMMRWWSEYIENASQGSFSLSSFKHLRLTT
ncbi:MAG: integrase domain-containing protein [Gammaproteobacteria bacterium]